MTEVFVVRRKGTADQYFSASVSSSSAPTVYTTAGKAEGRRKQCDWQEKNPKRYPDYVRQWEVVRWTLTEEAIGQQELDL